MGDSREKGGGDCPWAVWTGEELDWIRAPSRLYLRGVGRRYLSEWPFNEAHEKIIREYKPPRRFRLGLFIPCAYGKPYSQSYIHYVFRRVLSPYIRSGVIHEIILTNAGVVPRELDEHWPYVAYDWNPHMETREVRECYRQILKQRVLDYLSRFANYYDDYAAYMRHDSDSWAALREAAEDLGLRIVNLAPSRVDPRELEEAGLGLPEYMQDPDLLLITRTALKRLEEGLKRLLG